ncbi:MAG TPA: hypothetical protein VF820_03310, partial [Patescibacteria group bacterium]
MSLSIRKWFFIGVGIIVLVFLFAERAILTPFVAAAIFAYLFNPIVNFISKKSRLPRGFGIALIYSLL